jgi:hydroxylaminobenzene mutase
MENRVMDQSSRIRQGFLVHGASLFLIGLLAGAAVPMTLNPRMGLSAHLAAVQNGMFLLAVGAAWGHIKLTITAEQVAYMSGIASMYGFWFALELAAIWGTSRATPIAGAGFAADPWKENAVEALLRVSSVAAIVAAAVILIGFVRACRASTS